MLTTTIGSYPKPDFLALPDIYRVGRDSPEATIEFPRAVARLGAEAEALFRRAAAAVIDDQVSAGIDIPTDGEVRREGPFDAFARGLAGIDFDDLEELATLDGRATIPRPVLRGRPGFRRGPLDEPETVVAFRAVQAATDRPVKVTLPGPMTLAAVLVDRYYRDPRALGDALADLLNREIRALGDAKCRHVQLDEPAFAWRPKEAVAYGIEDVERAFHRCPDWVTRSVHVCRGHARAVDEEAPVLAPAASYFELAEPLDYAAIHAVAIEDARSPNDLRLLEAFRRKAVVLGAVAAATSRVEELDGIRDRLRRALEHIDGHRLMAAPDCGLGLLDRRVAAAKLAVMCRAAHELS